MKKLFFPLLILSFLLFQKCYYDKEELLYMSISSNCDTTNITYAGTISPIISTYCLGCHGNSAAASSGSGIKLENYADVKVMVDNGRFPGAVFQKSGYSAMPKDAGKLSDCKLSQIDIWIKSGSPNN